MSVAHVFRRPVCFLVAIALLLTVVVALQAPQSASAATSRATMCEDLMQDNYELGASWSAAMMRGDYISAGILSTAISWNLSTMMALQC